MSPAWAGGFVTTKPCVSYLQQRRTCSLPLLRCQPLRSLVDADSLVRGLVPLPTLAEAEWAWLLGREGAARGRSQALLRV